MDILPDEVPLCPHCDQPILVADYTVAQAHGAYYLAHRGCVDSDQDSEGVGRDIMRLMHTRSHPK